jgi:uncharacterized membrane protein YfcA
MMHFPISGVETPFWLPLLVAAVISYFTSMAGISGAVLLLPFQMSVLGFVTPAVSSTNLVFNVVAIPSGIYRYVSEGRLLWPLVWIVLAGTAPGVVAGGWLRLRYLPDPRPFQLFAGCVLLLLAVRLGLDIATGFARSRSQESNSAPARVESESHWRVQVLEFGWRRLAYRFQGRELHCDTLALFLMSLIVGLLGGAYGIGGGAILAPIFVAVFHLPIHAIAGATLMGTFATSVIGVVFYQLMAPHCAAQGLSVAPDWLLGGMFGLGGLIGMYLGARSQRRVPAVWIKIVLALILVTVSLRYIGGYFR